jgi:hypothetical protein
VLDGRRNRRRKWDSCVSAIGISTPIACFIHGNRSGAPTPLKAYREPVRVTLPLGRMVNAVSRNPQTSGLISWIVVRDRWCRITPAARDVVRDAGLSGRQGHSFVSSG